MKVIFFLLAMIILVGIIFAVVLIILKSTSKSNVDTLIDNERKENLKLISNAKKELISIRNYSNRINNPTLKEIIKSIVTKSDSILNYVGKNPDSANKMSNFIEYYLPATSKILYNYTLVVTNNLNTKETDDFQNKVSSFLTEIDASFDKQLAALFEDKILDSTAEIEVLKKSLESEGLLEYSDTEK